MSEILASVFRNKSVESVHYGSIVVTDNNGTVLYYCGDPELVTYTRSSMKAFQFLAVYESGATKRFGHNLQQIAIMLGSHLPIELRNQGEVPVAGVKYSPLAHNCSGKHSGQLALAVHIDDDPHNYIDPESKTQVMVRQAISEAYDYPADQFGRGTDGCSLPNYALPLRNMAKGYASLVTRTAASPLRREAYGVVIDAMTEHALMVSGNGRSDLAITEAGKGDVILKIGGEAVQVVGVISKGLGIAIKIADGNSRALAPVICEVLRQLGVFDDAAVKSLGTFARTPLYNDRKILIGEIVPTFKLQKG